MDRRAFCAALAAAAPDGRIRCAMIGTGHGHANSKAVALRSMAEFAFLGVCRPEPDDPVNGAAVARETVLDLDRVLADREIRMVAVELADPDQGLRYARRAVEAGKWVHLDRPPGSELSAFREMQAEAARRGLGVQMGYQWRYHPAMRAAMEAARNGWLGRIHRFRAAIDKPIGPEERRHLARYRGGMMFSEGCHLIDRATELFGKPSRIHSVVRHHGMANDGLADNSVVLLEYPNAIAEISMAGFDPHGNAHRRLEIAGDGGTAVVSPYTGSHLEISLADARGPYAAGEQKMSPPDPPGLPYTADFRALAAWMGGGKPEYTPAHDLMTHAVLLEACGMMEPKQRKL